MSFSPSEAALPSGQLGDKNETTRFLGDGVSFKAKLIGILEVSEARGDRMCQEALSDLKMAIRAAGEHKQRITINIAIDGLRLRDEKTGDSLYHHPVHKISFIAQDMTDSRAFGYIFGSPDTGHRFFGIKTDKAASQVVIAMRDLFQVVFALKKKEIELAKQHLDKTRYLSSPLFSDSSSVSSTKTMTPEPNKSHAYKAGTSSDSKSGAGGGTAVADLVDLELELNSLQQGLNQMERITPSDTFGSKDDPFGDSFTSYTKPILPPPPSSGRERSSRTSDSSSVFSPRTPHTVANLDATVDSSARGRKDFSFSQDFNSSRDEPSSADWFTPPAGNSIFEEPPLVAAEATTDEKHELAKQEILSQFDVFTELDPLGTGRSKPYIDRKHFFQELKNPPKKVLNDLVVSQSESTPICNPTMGAKQSAGDFAADPFGEDPFVTEDPFADSDFSKQDPFESEFGDFKKMNNLSRSPRTMTTSTSPRTVQFSKQQYEIHQLHENPSLDMSSESEAAPEPPPRPASTLMQIKPPPLPPKKQSNDMAVKPPPRPPHGEESVYLYMDHYTTAPNSLELIRNSANGVEKSPPIPVPARKMNKFEVGDFSKAPERPRKFQLQQSSDEDYLTPVAVPESTKSNAILLPPPQRAAKKMSTASVAVAVASTASSDNANVEGLDITLSQLTLSGLNELATKLKIPAGELSNMTLVQLTNYLSNFIKDKKGSNVGTNRTESNDESLNFKADFAANFSTAATSYPTESASTYDRYAVFRELIQEEIKQTKIDTEPEELREEQEKLAQSNDNDSTIVETNETVDNSNQDRYAALREIVEIEFKMATNEVNSVEEDDVTNENATDQVEDVQKLASVTVTGKSEEETDIINTGNLENNKLSEDGKSPNKYNLIEYSAPLDNAKEKSEPLKSPKSPIGRLNPLKSPVPVAITEIMQNTARLTSGSLSDVVSGSSPEVDNTASNSEMLGKKTEDAAAETWAIFDQNNIPSEVKEKQAVQSEEGLSPWSSDSKEFGNGSPPDWKRGDSERGVDKWAKRRGRRDQEGWWDTSAEPEAQYYSPANRRSTDSYDEEYYECYDRPRRRKQTSYGGGSQAAGGHSSSSRDVSPWEEEPSRRRERPAGWGRHPRQHSFDKLRDSRRHTDSWDDEEDDYEDYEEDHPNRFHRHERDRRADEWNEDRSHRRRREGDGGRWCCPECPYWGEAEHDKPAPRYGGGRWANQDVPPMRRDRHYSRESQESPWEDDYSNETDEPLPSHYPPAKRNLKRPSSASETDRKTGEIKSRHYLGFGGSDGERDRRYKPGRRSRSRDSQYSEPVHRHIVDKVTPARIPHRSRQYQHPKHADSDFSDSKKPIDTSVAKVDHLKKCLTLSGRGRKTKDSPKTEENLVSTFPRNKSSCRGKSLFENDFVSRPSDFETPDTPIVMKQVKNLRPQMSMFEKSSTGEVEFPSKESFRHRSLKEARVSPRFPPIVNKPKSLFEDDFSPSDENKADQVPEDNSISSIKEEIDANEEDDSFGASNFENSSLANNRKKKLNKHHRLSSDGGIIKKSESVNIFARENDPFDDDFFSESADVVGEHGISPRRSDLKWTDDF